MRKTTIRLHEYLAHVKTFFGPGAVDHIAVDGQQIGAFGQVATDSVDA